MTVHCTFWNNHDRLIYQGIHGHDTVFVNAKSNDTSKLRKSISYYLKYVMFPLFNFVLNENLIISFFQKWLKIKNLSVWKQSFK